METFHQSRSTYKSPTGITVAGLGLARRIGTVALAGFFVTSNLPVGTIRDGMMLLFGAVAAVVALRSLHTLPIDLAAVVFVFVLTACLSLVFEPPLTPYAAQKFSLLIVAWLLGMIFGPLVLAKPQAFVEMIRYLAIAATFLAVFTLTTVTVRQGRAAPWGLNPAILGRFLGLGVVYPIAQFFAGNSSRKLVVAGSVCFGAVLATGARTSIFGVVLIVVLLGVLDKRKKTSRLFTLASMGACAIAVGLAVAPPAVIERFSFSELSLARHSTEGNRIDVYRVAIESIVEQPFGIGVGNFSALHRFIQAPHNLILEFATELGWLSAALLIFLWLRANRTAVRLARTGNDQTIAAVFWFQSLGLFLGGEATLPAILLYVTLSLLACYPAFRGAALRRSSTQVGRS